MCEEDPLHGIIRRGIRAAAPDGRLVILEIATAMVVHDMDHSAAFRYKPARMKYLFDVFCTMVERKAVTHRERNDNTPERT